MNLRCSVKSCKSKDIALNYLGKDLCEKCWSKYADKGPEKLKAMLNIKR